MQLTETLQEAGQVEIEEISLLSYTSGKIISLIDYLIEINIYESLFSPTLSGEIVLSDSANLVKNMYLLGEELLYVKVRTPSLPGNQNIDSVFKIYGLDNRSYIKDGSTSVYTLRFTSIETFQDVLNPVTQALKGTPESIVEYVYKNFLMVEGKLNINTKEKDIKKPLTIFGQTANYLNFVSPGWSPVKCMSWISDNSLPVNNGAAQYLFWETTKGFYYGNVQDIKERAASLSIGTYAFSVPKIRNVTEEDENNSSYMYTIRNISIDKAFDQLENQMTGYISNRLVDVDLLNKKFLNVDYDHGQAFNTYKHIDQGKITPWFNRETVRNPKTHISVNYNHSKLFDNNTENFDVKAKFLHGNRRSNRLELENFIMRIDIPGRTDIEVGQTIYLKIPKDNPGAEVNKIEYRDDPMYSGMYIITNLCHKINLKTHYIAMNVHRDSLLTEFA